MLRTWVLENFKSVGARTEIELKPLTVLAGANSCGKSSLLHSILLICQTLESKVLDRALVFNGEHIKLGTFDDVRHHHATDEKFGIGFSLSLVRSDRPVRRRRIYRDSLSADVKLEFDSPSTSRGHQNTFAALSAARLTISVDQREACNVALERRPESEIESLIQKYHETSSLRVGYRIDGTIADSSYLYYRFDPVLIPLLGTEDTNAPVGVTLQHFLPLNLSVEYDMARRNFREVLGAILMERNLRQGHLDLSTGDDFRSQLQASARALVRDLVTQLKDEPKLIDQFPEVMGSKNGRPYLRLFGALKNLIEAYEAKLPTIPALQYHPLSDELSLGTSVIQDFFTDSVRYLGPLRDEPKPVYDTSASADTGDVGIKGQYTAAVLDIHQDDRVYYWDPESNRLENDSLYNASTRWLQYFGILHGVKTQDVGNLGHRMLAQPTSSDRELDLTNVGVGVSQVLPIVVMSLIAEPGSTLLFEQPELHLHPKVQSRLADFFIGLIRSGKQAIIETHSDHLINRLRLRIAEEELDSSHHLTDSLAMYFVERKDGHSCFKRVVVNEFGAIPDWPKDFFDQTALEADQIIEAAMRKRIAAKRRPRHD